MDGIRQYVLSVTAAAILCGTAVSLSPEGTARELIRFVAGAVLTVCLLRPLAGAKWTLSLPRADSSAGEALAADGEKQASQAMADIIKEQLRAYILDKAAALGAEVEAEFTLEDGDIPVPEAVTIRGTAAPYARQRLEEILSSQLGIPKERQQWTE